MTDEELIEKFRGLTMQLERVNSECRNLHIFLGGIDAQIKNMKDELMMPSGKVSMRLSLLEQQIQQLDAKLSS